MNSPTHKKSQVETHTIVQSIALHLLPGILFIPVFLLVEPFSDDLGFPKHLSPFLFTFLLVIVPFELGYLLLRGKKLNGHISLHNVIQFRDPMSWHQYILIGLPLLVWAAFIFTVIAPPVDAFFIERFFSWMPDGFFQSTLFSNLSEYSQPTLLMTGVFVVILIGVVGPVVEELYFRGYLLPRVPLKGTWAPLFHIVLFSVYHLWSPWQNVIRILAMSPLYFAVWHRRNIYLGIVWHVVANVLSAMMLIVTLLRAA